MEGIWGAYLMIGGFAIIVLIAILWPSKKKTGKESP